MRANRFMQLSLRVSYMASHMGAKMAPGFSSVPHLAEGALNKLYVVASETLLIGRLKVAYAPQRPGSYRCAPSAILHKRASVSISSFDDQVERSPELLLAVLGTS